MARIKKMIEIKRPQKSENRQSFERSLEDEIREVKNESEQYAFGETDLPGADTKAHKKNKSRSVPVKKSIEDIFQKGNQISGGRRENKTSLLSKIVMVFLLLVFLALIGYGVWGYIENQKTKKAQEKISLSSAIKEMPPVNTEKQEEDNSAKEETKASVGETNQEKSPAEIKIRVLNGGAPSGSALKVKTLLVASGYSKTEAGNADKSDNLGVKIYSSSDLVKEAEKLLAVLKKDYPSSVTRTATTVEEKSAEIVVILGK